MDGQLSRNNRKNSMKTSHIFRERECYKSILGDVVDYRAINHQRFTQSLNDILSNSSINNSQSVFGEVASYCKCSVCFNVFGHQGQGGISTSETFGVPDYKICDRTLRLNDHARLQEVNCWKCRSHCWQNYSLSHAWTKKRKVIPTYKRRPHHQIVKLPEILESSGPVSLIDVDIENQVLQGDVTQLSSFNLKLPQIKTKQVLAKNMLPQAIVAEVFGVTPSLNYHYQEKSEAQMRWLLIKASLKRLIKMDKERKAALQDDFNSLIKEYKRMEQRNEEEKKRQEELDVKMQEDQTKQKIVKKIRMSKFKNSMEKVLREERDKREKEQQLLDARQKALSQKIQTFRHEIELVQRKISAFLLPRTVILVDTKRSKLQKRIMDPLTRPKDSRSQSALDVRDAMVDSIWMEPEIDTFLSDVDWLNELILNKMRTDFIERVSNAFIKPLKTNKSKSCPNLLKETADYRFVIQKRATGQCKTDEDVIKTEQSNTIYEETQLNCSLDSGLDKIPSDIDLDSLYKSLVSLSGVKRESDEKCVPVSKLGIKSSQMTASSSALKDRWGVQESKIRTSSAPIKSQKLSVNGCKGEKSAQKSIVLNLNTLQTYEDSGSREEAPEVTDDAKDPEPLLCSFADDSKNQDDLIAVSNSPAEVINDVAPAKKLRRASLTIMKRRADEKKATVGQPVSNATEKRLNARRLSLQNQSSPLAFKPGKAPSWATVKSVIKAKQVLQTPVTKTVKPKRPVIAESVVIEESVPEKAEPDCVLGEKTTAEDKEELEKTPDNAITFETERTSPASILQNQSKPAASKQGKAPSWAKVKSVIKAKQVLQTPVTKTVKSKRPVIDESVVIEETDPGKVDLDCVLGDGTTEDQKETMKTQDNAIPFETERTSPVSSVSSVDTPVHHE